MNNIEQIFSELTLFSDINWETVSNEYQAEFSHLSFPEYLQEKAHEGDCPSYVFELAFFQQALHQLKSEKRLPPPEAGISLNPTALFLNLEFDVRKMLEDSKKGEINIYQRPHVLCLFYNQNLEICMEELDHKKLTFLGLFEDNTLKDKNSVAREDLPIYEYFLTIGLIRNHSSHD